MNVKVDVSFSNILIPLYWLRRFRTGNAGYTDCDPEHGLSWKILLTQ